MSQGDLIIVGSGGHARSVASVARSAGFNVVGLLDERNSNKKVDGYTVIKKFVFVEGSSCPNFALGIGDNYARFEVYRKLTSDNAAIKFPKIVHPSSVIAAGASIGDGVVLMPNTNVGSSTVVSEGGLLNNNASIDHDCQMSPFSSLAPGCVTGGGVRIGSFSALLIGACVSNNITIGDNTVVGGCSFVNRDLPDSVLSYGVPCKVISSRSVGDPYMG